MVFEDVQWADDSLLDFVDYLLEWSRDFPLFVCTLARPELHERRPAWGAGQRNFTSLYLEPLSPTAMDQAADRPRTRAARRAARCKSWPVREGIPLYAVETVRMMLDRGALVQDGPVYRPAGPIAALEVPETLHALIAARLDGLAPEERRLLQDAAVLGKTFTERGLSRCSPPWPSRSSSRCSTRSSARRCSSSRPIPAPPSTASTASSRTWSATSPTRRSRNGSAARATSPRPRTSSPILSRRGGDRRGARLPLPGCLPGRPGRR